MRSRSRRRLLPRRRFGVRARRPFLPSGMSCDEFDTFDDENAWMLGQPAGTGETDGKA